MDLESVGVVGARVFDLARRLHTWTAPHYSHQYRPSELSRGMSDVWGEAHAMSSDRAFAQDVSTFAVEGDVVHSLAQSASAF